MEGLKRRKVEEGTTRLVPYDEQYVAAYNEAMKSTELQELTGSEPLTLEEEHAMCAKWAADPNMLCLLVVDADGRFIGDVNAHRGDEGVAEVDVMICRPEDRRCGHASRALQMLFGLLGEVEGIAVLEAKIKLGNAASIGLFEKKLGFTEHSVSDAFQEVTFRRALRP